MAFMAAAIPYIAAASAALGAVTTAVGAVQQGNAQKQAADYNAQVSRVQAINAQTQASAQAQQTEQDTRRKLGEAAAAFGAAGVDMTGSPLAVMSDLGTQGELSKRLAIYRGTVAAQSDTQQAAIDVTTGQAAQSAGFTKAAGSLLTGFSNTAKAAQPFFMGSSAGSSPAGGAGP